MTPEPTTDHLALAAALAQIHRARAAVVRFADGIAVVPGVRRLVGDRLRRDGRTGEIVAIVEPVWVRPCAG